MTVPINKVAGVCGWPIHHSLSPVLHQFWLTKMQIKGGYIAFAVHPDEADMAFQSLKLVSISGVNVTAPLKHLAYKAADRHTPEAKKLGVANCLYKEDGKLIAHNTDLEGFTRPLIEKTGESFLKTNPAIIFGAGGAAKAALGALLDIGVPEIRVCARRDEQARDVTSDINLPNVHHLEWSKRQDSLKTAGLIVNATTAGMHGRSGLDISLINTREDIFVYDLVYTPILTPLIVQARELNRPFLGGLEMLIAQARPSFKLFFGVEPDRQFDPTELLLKHLEN